MSSARFPDRCSLIRQAQDRDETRKARTDPAHKARTGDPRAFISEVRGYRPRWALLFAASVLTVCCLGAWLSNALFQEPTASQTNAVVETTSGDQAAMPTELEENQPTAQTRRHNPDRLKESRLPSLFSFQSEAEASLQHSSRLAGPRLKPGDIGTVATDIAGSALETCSKTPTDLDTKEALLRKQIETVLQAVHAAASGENMDSFLALLDESESSFVRRQRLKAKFAFRCYDDIEGTYSDVKIKVLNENEVAVTLHCTVKAASASSGRPVVLFDGDQDLRLRKAAATGWKICAIDA